GGHLHHPHGDHCDDHGPVDVKSLKNRLLTSRPCGPPIHGRPTLRDIAVSRRLVGWEEHGCEAHHPCKASSEHVEHNASMRIKICGVTTPEDAALAAR